MSEFKFPTEVIDLPSKGLLYPESNPLSSGKLEMKYMTAKEEDILSNQSYIQKGTVLDKLLESLITTKEINANDLVTGDKNALLIGCNYIGTQNELSGCINDVVNITSKAIETTEPIFDVFNVGSGISTNVLKVAEALSSHFKIKVTVTDK